MHRSCDSPLKTLKMRLKGEPSGGTLTYRLATAPAMNRLMAAMKAAVGMPKPTPAVMAWTGSKTRVQAHFKGKVERHPRA
jgi:hypothetical protein